MGISKSILIFLIFLLSFTVQARAEIIISEIMYDPTTEQGGDSLIEWIELYNTGSQAVNTSGWTLTDNSATDTLGCYNTTLTNCGIINATSFAIITDSDTVLYQNFSIFTNANRIKVDDNAIGNGLSNSGDVILIRNSTGDLIDAVNYTGFTSVSEGFTLERIDPLDTNSSSNWKSSLSLNGTPGYRNSVTPLDNDLTVENITFSPTDPSPRTGVNITISIKNQGISNQTSVNVSTYNSSGSVLTLIDSKLLNITKQSSANFTTIWNNTAKNNFTILVSISNADDNLTNNNATKNISVDFHLVLNEIMYNPPEEIGSDADFEWTEIYNNASYSENLTGWFFQCDSKSKTLTGTLGSGNFLVFAKDVTNFYTYYSKSIATEGETCSFNNGGDTIKLVLNDSGIYHEESVTYSPSWGADGTGYTLEKINPTTNNAANNWAESKTYAGTSGQRNNPDNQIKPSLKQTQTVYVTTQTSSGSVSLPVSEKENYEIVDFKSEVYIGEDFTTVVKLQSDIKRTFVIYSYVFDGNKLLSEGYNGNEWQSGWTANEQEMTVDPKAPTTIKLKNKIKLSTSPGTYKLRVRIKDVKDLTKGIYVMPQIVANTTVSSTVAAMVCREENNLIKIEARGNGKNSLYIFSKDGLEIRDVALNGETIETIEANDGYNYILLVNGNAIQDRCNITMDKSKLGLITGKSTETQTNILEIILRWLSELLK